MKLRRCQHLRTRCIHGDEILQAMKVYLRWWKPEKLRRQRCLDCGRALERDAVCVILGKDIHVLHVRRGKPSGTVVCDCSIHNITRLGAAHADDCPAGG